MLNLSTRHPYAEQDPSIDSDIARLASVLCTAYLRQKTPRDWIPLAVIVGAMTNLADGESVAYYVALNPLDQNYTKMGSEMIHKSKWPIVLEALAISMSNSKTKVISTAPRSLDKYEAQYQRLFEEKSKCLSPSCRSGDSCCRRQPLSVELACSTGLSTLPLSLTEMMATTLFTMTKDSSSFSVLKK